MAMIRNLEDLFVSMPFRDSTRLGSDRRDNQGLNHNPGSLTHSSLERLWSTDTAQSCFSKGLIHVFCLAGLQFHYSSSQIDTDSRDKPRTK